MIGQTTPQPPGQLADDSSSVPAAVEPSPRPPEFGGRPGPEPTRYGDWEKDGRCIDF
ncbi:DUF1674 domain-containing protein [Lysobacter lacus]|uniref:DUF1674 domain-containing protein n=1 Tax=Cognatilysobacter lacus TaxID=1643323 RepID=A0A5D8Z4I7_9GAMM|nr:DUF1674 domain-containing protein [Lysobacter lacus]